MTILIFSIIFLFNILLVISNKTSRVVSFLSLITIIFLMTGNGLADNSLRDYYYYMKDYEALRFAPLNLNFNSLSDFISAEIGMDIINKFGNILGLEFFSFRFILITLSIFALFFPSIKSKRGNNHLVIIFYMIYPMIIDSIQLANLLALVLLTYSIFFLSKNSRKGDFIAIIFWLLSVSIHSAFIFYIIIFLIKFPFTDRTFKLFIGVVGVLSIISTIAPNLILNLVEPLIASLDDSRITSYFEFDQVNFVRTIQIICINIVTLYSLYIGSRFYFNKQDFKNSVLDNYKTKSNHNAFIKNVYFLNFISVIFFPLYIVDLNFYRLSRNYIFMNADAQSIIYNDMNKKNSKSLLFLILCFLIVLLWFYYEFGTSFEGVLVPFFTQNYFFN